MGGFVRPFRFFGRCDSHLLHLGVDVEARVAELRDLLGQELHAVHRVAEDDGLVDLQLMVGWWLLLVVVVVGKGRWCWWWWSWVNHVASAYYTCVKSGKASATPIHIQETGPPSLCMCKRVLCIRRSVSTSIYLGEERVEAVYLLPLLHEGVVLSCDRKIINVWGLGRRQKLLS